LKFDPKVVSYDELLDVFWVEHDPTSIGRQGVDIGKRYRSVIFYHDEGQKKEAEKSKDEKEERLGNKIVTEIVKAGKFHKAEEEHQKYSEKHGVTCSVL